MNNKILIFVKVISLLGLQLFICSTDCFSVLSEFLFEEDAQGIPCLRQDTKIPVGLAVDTVHHITLASGTPLTEISPKISLKREEIGLPPHISLEHQDNFFQNCCWQTPRSENIKAPMTGKIIQVFVHKGQQIGKDDKLCVMEAMKMQNTIRSPSSGEITQISFKENDKVDNASILISLLPASPRWKDIDQIQILESKDLLIPFFPWTTVSPIETPVSLPLLPQDSTVLPAAIALEMEPQNLTTPHIHSLNEVSVLISEAYFNVPTPCPILTENENNQSIEAPTVQQLQLSSLHLEKATLPGSMRSLTKENFSVEQRQTSLPLLPQDSAVLPSAIALEMRPQNFTIFNISPLNESGSISMIKVDCKAHEISALCKATSLSIVEFDNKEKLENPFEKAKSSLPLLSSVIKSVTSTEEENFVPFNFSLKKSIVENNYSFQPKCSPPKSKPLLKKPNVLDDESNFSIGTWVKRLIGLIALIKLIFALTTLRNYILLRRAQYRIIYSIILFLRKPIYLDTSNFNKYRFIINQLPSNINGSLFFQAKLIKI